MKLIFKTLLIGLVTFSIYSRDIIVITYQTESHGVKFYRKEFLRMKMPKGYYNFVQKNNPCKKDFQNAILHLCFNNNDDVGLVSQNQKALKNSMKMFVQ